MEKILRLGIAAAVLIGQATAQGNEVELARILHFDSHFPGVIEQSFEYETDLFQVLKDQRELEGALAEIPEYMRLKGKEVGKTYFDIVIGSRSENRVLTREAASAFQSEIFDRNPVWLSKSSEELKGLLTRSARALGDRSSDAFLVGLIKAHSSPGRQKELLSLSSAAKLAALQNELPEGALSKSFKAELHGLPGGTLEKREALEFARWLMETEKEVTDLGLLRILEEIRGPTPLSDALAILREKVPEASPQVHGRVQARLKTELSGRLISSSSSKLALRLRQVPPEVALFRGCVGKDCSTKLTAGYALSPMEKVFFVTGKDERLKGYVAATELVAGGRKSLYVHTISGANLSGEDTRAILRSFHEIRSQLGVEEIVLPTFKQLQETVRDHPVPRGEITKAIRGAQSVDLIYHDPETRWIVGRSSSSSLYDDPKTNREGMVFRPETLSGDVDQATHVQVSRKTFPRFDGDAGFDRNHAVRLYAALNAALENDRTGGRDYRFAQRKRMADKFANVLSRSDSGCLDRAVKGLLPRSALVKDLK